MKKIIFSLLSLLVLLPSSALALSQANSSATVVIGQTDFTHNSLNQGGSVAANTLYCPEGVFSDGTRLFIADDANHRVLIYNTIPTANNASADVVIGQADMTHGSVNQGGAVAANTLYYPEGVFSDGTRLFIADDFNHRVLIYNTIPTANNASADVVIGQADMTHGSVNQGGAVAANTLYYPEGVFSDGTRLFIADYSNNRVLIYNTIPTANNASADVVIGQADMTHGSVNQGGSVAANTLYNPAGVYSDGTRLFIADYGNNRVLIYNTIPTSNNASADVVVGQPDLVTENYWPEEATANNIGNANAVTSDGTRLYVSDSGFNRILIYNTIPTTNGASADVVIGQPDFTSKGINQGSNVGANTLNFNWWSLSLSVSHDKLFVPDTSNHRVLIYPLGPQNTSASAPSQTSEQTINLTLAADDAKEMMLSEHADFSGAGWQSYTTGLSHTLADDSYEHNLYIKFRDWANYESAVHTAQVKYNKPAAGGGLPAGATSPPTAPSAGAGFGVTVNNGESLVNTREVTLNFQAGSDTTKVAIAEDPSFTNAPLLDYAPTMNFTLSEGNGPKTIYVKFYTQYGYATEPVSTSITLNDQASPTLQAPEPTPISSYVAKLIKYPDSPTVYLINQNNEKQPFYNALAFTENGHQWSAIETVTPENNWPTGEMLYPSDYTEPATPIWSPPAGYEYIASPAQFPNYTQIISEPNSPRKYGLPKTTVMSQPSGYHHGFTFSEYLSLGYNSPEVRNLQRVLKDLGYYQYPTATGYYGTLTESSVKQFQKDRQITPTGTVGPKTREVLNGMR